MNSAQKGIVCTKKSKGIRLFYLHKLTKKCLEAKLPTFTVNV